MNANQKWTPFNVPTVVVAQGTTDTVATFNVKAYTRIFVEVVVSGFAIDAFVIAARAHPSGSFLTLYSAALDYTAPSEILVGASGDLTTQAVGSGWFIMDVIGLEQVRISASSGNAAGSTVVLYAGGV